VSFVRVAPALLAALACAPPPDGEPPVSPPGEGGSWQQLAPLAGGPRQETGVATLDGEVYVVGGFDASRGVTSMVEAYDPATDRWRRVADTPLALHHANVGAAAGKLVIAGFLTGGGFVENDRVFVYDPAQDAWSEGEPLPPGTARGGSAVAVLDDEVYVIGGRGSGARADVARYDPSDDSWELLPSLPEPRDHVVAGVIDSKIYVAGGRLLNIGAHRADTWVFDPGDESWSAVADMPTSRAGAAGAALDGRLYVFGGEGSDTETGVFEQVEAYDPAEDAWERLAAMPLPRHGMGAAALADRIYVPGGGDIINIVPTDHHDSFVP
jgi:N-acetylneuraminic acid mutarotase